MEQGHVRKLGIVRMRNYGRIIQDMVKLAVSEQDAEKKQAMVIYIAQCMRQKNALWNREQESGIDRLKDDIRVLSGGALSCDFPEFDDMIKRLALRPLPSPDRQMMPKKKKK